MIKNNTIILFCLLAVAASCYEDYFTDGKGFLPASPSYSLPLGDVMYNVEPQLELIENNAYTSLTTPDSIEIDNIIYPLPFEEIYVTQDVNFDFSEAGIDSRKIKNLFLRLIVENSFPTEIGFKVVFTDDDYSPLHNQTDNDTFNVPPAYLDENNLVSKPFTSIVDLPVPEEVINNIAQLKKIVIVSLVKTKNPEVLISRFNSRSQVNIHIGMRIEFDLEISEKI